MGIDCIGLSPQDERGVHFRASVWTWPSVIAAVNLTRTTVTDDWLYTNEQTLIETQMACNYLADQLICVIKNKPKIKTEMLPWTQEVLDNMEKIRQDAFEGACATAIRKGKPPPKSIDDLELDFGSDPTSREIDYEVVAEFEQFLRRCGGFQLW